MIYAKYNCISNDGCIEKFEDTKQVIIMEERQMM